MAKNHVSDFSTTASNNTDIIGENVAPGSAMEDVNDALRAYGKIHADFYDDIGGSRTATGTADAIVVSGATQTLAAGEILTFVASADNTTATTLNWNSLGVKDVKKMVSGSLAALAAGDIKNAAYTTVIYDGTQFVLVGNSSVFAAGTGDFLADGTVPMTGNFDAGGNGITSLDQINGASTGADNLLIGGWFITNPWQWGASFTAATTPANNDDTYLPDRWKLISDGNDVVDVSQDTDGSLKALVATANKQFGFVQIVKASNCNHIIDDVVSIAARLKASGLTTFRMVALSWAGTADAVTSDVVGTWAGGGTEPTWATNWTREGSVVDITATGSLATTKGDNISVDTASTKQIAFVIWLDDTDGSVSDTVNIEWLSVMHGTSHPDEPRFQSAEEVAIEVHAYHYRIAGNSQLIGVGNVLTTTVIIIQLLLEIELINTPTFTVSSATHISAFAASSSGGSTAINGTNEQPRGVQIEVTRSGLTAGESAYCRLNSSSAWLDLDAEL